MDTEVLSRRDLFRAAGAVAVTAALPASLLAQGSLMQGSPVRRPIVGSGAHTYEVYHDWLTPPMNLKWGDTHGLAVDRQGHIYVAHTVHEGSVSRDAIAVFDPKGRFMESWGSEFAGGAHGLDLRREGSEEFLYHCDTRRRKVVKTNLRGRVVWETGMPREAGVYADESKWCPTNVAFDPNGDLIVGDGYGSHYVHRYSKDGEFKGVLITPGSEAGKVREPHGLWVDSRGRTPELMVADRGNRRLQRFTLDGKHLGFVNSGLRRPCHVHFNRDMVLIPDLDSVVTILGRDNQVLAHLGDGQPTNLRGAARDKFIPGKFIHPHAAIWINRNDILVAEWVPIGRLTLLRKVS